MTEQDFPGDAESHASGESYYVSITDLLIGLLFIFIILLVYFSAQLRDQSEQIVSSTQTRSELLKQMAADMEESGIPVELDLPHGILRLSGDKLFEVGQRDPTSYGQTALAALSATMARHLPCYSFVTGRAERDCPLAPHTVDTIVIEGHTDNDPIRSSDWVRDNWDLSAARATSAYRLILAQQPGLGDLRNAPPQMPRAEPIFSAAGYADQRPISGNANSDKTANRRIDLRVVMAPPAVQALAPSGPDDLNWPRRSPPDEIGYNQLLRFTRGRTTEGHLGQGWSRPETWGAWSNGPQAQLILPLKPGLQGKPLRVEIIGVAFVTAESPDRNVQVWVNDRQITSWHFEYPANEYAYTVDIPADLTSSNDPVIIDLRTENPVSPYSLGLSPDARALGVGVSSVRIVRAP